MVLRQGAEELAKLFMLPILFGMTDPPSRKQDRRPLAIDGVGQASSITGLAKSDSRHEGILSVPWVSDNGYP
jgi:hypothetical protein